MEVLRYPFILTASFVFASPYQGSPPGPKAEAYFQEAVAIIKSEHINSSEADWLRVIPDARILLDGAVNPADTYPAIRSVLASLKERHSFLMEAARISEDKASPSDRPTGKQEPGQPLPLVSVIDGHIGRLHLPELIKVGPDGQARGNAYTTMLKNGLLNADQSSDCGWILDLRDNGGGNMWPMLKGLDPLLGDAPFGFFVLPNRAKQAWRRASGNIFPHFGELPPSPPAFTLDNSAAPITILIGPMTASSGEMVAIALIGRTNVRVFGKASAGFTTANATHKLKDGAVLAVTVSGVADRTGKYYSGPIKPDERNEPIFTESAARKWLLDQCAVPKGR